MTSKVTASINISIVNQSTVVTQAEAQAAAVAIQTQLNRDFYPLWGMSANIYMTPVGHTVPKGYWQVAILDDSDMAGALGYHDLTTDGLPLAKVFAKTDQTFGLSWTVTLSHEVLEMVADPWINNVVFEQVTNTSGRLYSYEVCDACEDDSLAYDINGVKVSDFVTPQWFESGSQGARYDFLGHISAPFELLTGGYVGYFDVGSGGGWQQLFAQDHAMRANVSMKSGKSRMLRRSRPRHEWIRSSQ